ncbi:putative polyhydroxyalkanoic acid system protein [Bacteriovorax sp. BSW11_IV]|uniref:polyhydroxyalkanoic acid system family protein n=1 Tax=Bacteriovorax sp. BSW11_IV TaxID=1353529 RepID=UPI00038A46F5|nr:polyhydroxyalkanoic acid system family protein [Bacteriovorax sp. BSW11_IV]EQC48489.1 putative polyhydroxyalkanoic acid system protein [Bacteriovorax sp. BSW11_IV]
MDLVVNYKKAASKEEGWDLAKAQITPEYVAKFNVKAEINYDRASGKIIATGKGFTLSLEFSDNDCKVGVELSLMLRPFKGKILEAVQNKLEKTV